jgi:VWFA-related protein
VVRRLGVVACLACTAAYPSARQNTQVFSGSTHVVPVYATVTDGRGELVSDLGVSDFQIEDNGVRQSIAIFKHDIQPITIAILLDASPSLFPAAGQTTAVVAELTRRLLPDDRACVGTFSHVVTLDPHLTGRADALVARLGAPAPWPAGTALWDAIEAGRTALADEGGRRVILVVTDGEDNASRVDPDAARAALQREGVIVYAVAVRGRFGLDMSEVGALANATGGRAMELKSSTDVSTAIQRVADELHAQYVLGFNATKLDGKLHRLDVTVKRPGATVRARRTYFAAKAEVK